MQIMSDEIYTSGISTLISSMRHRLETPMQLSIRTAIKWHHYVIWRITLVLIPFYRIYRLLDSLEIDLNGWHRASIEVCGIWSLSMQNGATNNSKAAILKYILLRLERYTRANTDTHARTPRDWPMWAEHEKNVNSKVQCSAGRCLLNPVTNRLNGLRKSYSYTHSVLVYTHLIWYKTYKVCRTHFYPKRCCLELWIHWTHFNFTYYENQKQFNEYSFNYLFIFAIAHQPQTHRCVRVRACVCEIIILSSLFLCFCFCVSNLFGWSNFLLQKSTSCELRRPTISDTHSSHWHTLTSCDVQTWQKLCRKARGTVCIHAETSPSRHILERCRKLSKTISQDPNANIPSQTLAHHINIPKM